MPKHKYPTLKIIVQEYLKEKGYDGLWDEYNCGCELDDLMVCGDPHLGCRAGYKVAECIIGLEKRKGGSYEKENERNLPNT